VSTTWSGAERSQALSRAERDGLDLLVIGGGITGAGVLRDAASRGLRALVVERADFASGTSSRSSKLVHGGLRYIGEGQLSIPREACAERDRLLRLDPNLVRPVPFLFPAHRGGRVPLWQVRAALWVYAALASFRRTSRFRMLTPDQAVAMAGGLRREGLLGAGLYTDGQVDDARLVIEVLKAARALGAEAVNHAEVTELSHDERGRLVAARVRDRLDGRTRVLRADAFVNAAGPAVERVRGLDRRDLEPELRPAKGVHLVIPRPRIPAEAAVTFEGPDGRHLFLLPWDDLALVGTTDTFSDAIDEPVVTIEEVHYLLEAANAAFPMAGLTTNDLVSVYAGVRPLVAPRDAAGPPSSVSREDRRYADPSGLISAAGGKLTSHRAMAERIVDDVVRRLPPARRRALGRSRTRELAIRPDAFDRAELEAGLAADFGVGAPQAAHLVRTYGAEARPLLEVSAPEWRVPIGRSRYLLAELPWCLRTECAADLCDLLERRVRVALFSPGQGLPEIDAIARAAASAGDWDAGRQRDEVAGYARSLRRHYQIVAPSAVRARSAA